ncbi:MAG: dimethylmenaquinone methyltransferase [Thermodesulfobacteriota bacterium]|nr:MAG: dimethylmenaquinone methyltransferase [Thermodesulfobacteriota bacterium]
MSEYKEIVEKLNLKKQELEERLDRVKSSLRKTHAKDWSEQAQERENEEVVEKLDENIRIELNQVNEALSRVEKNEYGICEVCDGPIRAERLEALPYTDRCFNCASELE